MNVVLLILKIIGIVLLLVLALVVILLLLFLFVPFSYRGRFRNTEGTEGVLSAGWLFGIFRVLYRFNAEKKPPELRILWVFQKKLDFASEKTEKPEEEKESEEESEKKPIKERLLDLTDKTKKLAKLADNDRIQSAVSHAFRVFGKLLKAVMPKKLNGAVELGLKEPYDTARAVSFIAFLIPLHKNEVELVPDFENEVFRADVSFKGRLFLITVVWYGLSIVLNRDVLYAVRCYKKFFGKKKEENTNG